MSFSSARALHFFSDYKYSRLAQPSFESSLEKTANGLTLTITAQSVIRDLTLMIDKLDPLATVDKGLVTLLPGESFSFEVTTKLELSLSELTSKTVLRSANQLVVSN